MKPEVRRMVFFPRYTALSGARTFATQPIPLREFGLLNFTVWRGTAMGTSPTVQFAIAVSNDLEHWTTVLGPATLTANSEASYGPYDQLDFDWIRLEFTLGGSDPAVNCWAIGDFQLRDAGSTMPASKA